MTVTAQQYDARVINIAGLTKAVAIDSDKIGLEKVLNLHLCITEDGEEIAYPLEYLEKESSYFCPYLPSNLDDEIILKGELKVVE